MRALLIGCGQMGRTHLSNLFLNEFITQVSIVDKKPEVLEDIARLASGKEYSFYHDLNQSLQELGEDVDLCVIASNTACHKEHLKALLSHFQTLAAPPLLFMEKPLLQEFSELDELYNAIKCYPGHIIGGYLIRHSEASIKAAQYLKERSLTIKAVNVQWTKNRVPNRPSPGVLVDETTHALDLVLSYFLKQTGANIVKNGIDVLGIKGELSNSVVDQRAQLELYGTLLPQVAADLHYRLKVQSEFPSGSQSELILNGRSSFNAVKADGSADFKRSVELVCSDNTTLSLEFDANKEDVLTIMQDEAVVFCERYCGDKAKAELDRAVLFQRGLTDFGPQAERGDLIKDLQFVELLQQKIKRMYKFMTEDQDASAFFKYKKTREREPHAPTPNLTPN